MTEISIHALLAESDRWNSTERPAESNFYPRSPCGERLVVAVLHIITRANFYPRSPCGERQPATGRNNKDNIFLSTLSLRRATWQRGSRITYVEFLSTLSLRRATNGHEQAPYRVWDFYPRSPCGERPCITTITICTV